MTDLLANIALGFGVAVTPVNLFYCLLGVTLGTMIGILPGIGPSATVALLLPITYTMPDTAALIMLAGIFYGAQYGGSTTAILVNLPGESSSVVTCIDGYAMARQGRAGVALATAALGSFFAGTVATILIVVVAKPLSAIALAFGPADYFSLVIFGLLFAVFLSSGSPVKAIGMVAFGIALSLVGIDPTSGEQRFTFGMAELFDGIDFVVLAIGLLGVSEILFNLQQGVERDAGTTKTGSLMPTRQDFKQAFPAVLRGTALGSFLGVLPGGGAIMSSFASYALERKIAKDPSRFGKGAIEGLAGPESANNAGAQTSFIPLLTLGIPANGLMALMVGAMMIQGITPGPEVMQSRPDLFWGLIASMWVGNLLLLVLNLPLIGIWVRLLGIPYRFLCPAILMFCAIGAYGLSYSVVDVLFCAVFGIVGFLLRKIGCEPAPLVLGFVLGPLLEQNMRLGLLISQGSFSTFVTHPISATLLALSGMVVIMMAMPAIMRRREVVFQGDDD
ncbi:MULTISPECIES: tripartite tricarboxylate transporter permease [Agrobacterium]|uniref:TctA family transporter n=1 Tax=Agrobacterium tumefaciens TaxID=358 RepID=A0AAW8LUS0_AGRTU|nr:MULTISPECIES: tripartite tricarboxylate transporter permease [Agrobacterium]MBP2565923.1 TctA family transporter [Agrobacterium tumefaciens]MDR6702780.1 TctA family transporter [Agrobacterium tumefaciens]TCV53789.1 TctA family transporter [Agrobacterium tumefaciens]WHO23922.1 tripartite tricarboxylate transporter permease [Agrobacterium tumefaciens]